MNRFILIIICISFFQFAHGVEIKAIEDTITTSSNLTKKPQPDSFKKVEDLNYNSEESVNTDPDLALQYALRAEKMAGNNKKELARAILNHGIAEYYLDNYEKGIELSKKALDISIKLDDEHGQGMANNIIGEIYVYTAKYADALSYLSKARAQLENTNDNKNLARCNNNMGIIHKNQYNLNEALTYFKRAFEIGDDYRKGDATLYMGMVYLGQKKFTEAERSFREAIKYAKINEDQYVKADALEGLGQVNTFFGKHDEAKQNFLEALAIKEEVEDLQGISTVCNGLGNLFLQSDDAENAFIYFSRSVQIAEEIQTKEELKDAYLGMSNTYHLMGDDKLAFENLDKYNKINEEILSEEASKKLGALEESLAAEKRKQEEAFKEKEREARAEQEKFKLRIYFIIGGIILLIFGFAAWSMYRRNKLKQKANEKLTALNAEITAQKDEIEKQKNATEMQKHIIEEKNKEITDSINYARKIQFAILPKEEEFTNAFPDSFVLFKPKDIVSGDFYWFTKVLATSTNSRRGASDGRRADTDFGDVSTNPELYIYATCDCTGHGVPGGFMSMLGTSLLNETINEKGISKTGQILDLVRDKLITEMKQTGVEGENKDGMDLVLTCYDLKNMTLTYSAANNGFYIIRNGEMLEFVADKQPIGYYGDAMKPFTENVVELQKGDCVYTFTDGYADQFGGPKGKKYKYKQFEELLLSIWQKPMREQHQILNDSVENWRGDLEQNDDICVIGVRI
jgi:serine phosphatase RsbU (regulator of sigma subunit)/Tfp pilus assembly protein PilF